ncbi:hypothetical protein JYT87_00600 [Nitrospira defluvii]|nr:hypothetical protein [Nitrospira defluvii]
MGTLFRVEASDITDLNDLHLTKLLKLMLHLEARSAGIAERAVDVALNITVADGGEDGRIQWKDGPSETNFLPCRFVQFQIKATEMGPTDCANEIINDKGTMKPMIEDVLDNSGAYILFTSQELNSLQKIPNRIKKIREKLSDLGKPYAYTATIEIYDASKIDGWVNKYILAIVAVLNWVGRPIEKGLKTWTDWSQIDQYGRFPFVADESRLSAIKSLRLLLNKEKKCARIMGLSGMGKTRLAFEVFREVDGYDDLSRRVVYIDSEVNPSIAGIISDWVRCKLEGIIVVDNCNISLHDKIRKEVQREDSKLSLLSLDFDLETTSQTDPFHLKKLPDKYIKEMLEPDYGREIPDLDRIVVFAQGFPQMAVLLADARLDREPEMGSLTDDHLARKILWGSRNPNDIDEKILKGCALFDRFGLDEGVSDEYKFIAKEIVDVSSTKFYDCIKRFEERGVIDRRGRYARLVPTPLAIRLSAEWWRRTTPEKQIELIQSNMPGGLVRSFCDQISRLDFLPEVKNLTEHLCGPQGPFGQAEVILSDRGSLLFRSLVEVNPESTSRALANLLKKLREDELYAIDGDVRRNLVWALEKLCFHKTCFEESASSLMLLASAENEKWSNNATGLFTQLFDTFLSGTEAPPNLRLKVIDYALSSEKSSIRKLGVDALEQAVDPHGGVRTVGAEHQGSGEPLKAWRPEIWGEAFDYWEEALDRLCKLVVRGDPFAVEAKSAIAIHIRSLMQRGRVDKLDDVINRIVEVDGPLWPQALKNIKNSLRYEGSEMPPEGKKKLKDWILLLTPQNLDERLKLIVSMSPMEHEKQEDGNYVDFSAENAKKLAEELSSDIESIVPYLDSLLIGEQKQAYWFAKHLVQSAGKWEPLLSESIKRIKIVENPNVTFLMGILNGIFNCNPIKWGEIANIFYETDDLIIFYAQAISSGKVTLNQLDNVVELIAQGKIIPSSAKIFTYGRPLEHMGRDDVCQFVQKLASLSGKSAWVSLNILSMYCHGNMERWNKCRNSFKKIVLTLHLNSDKTEHQREIYDWHDVVNKLLKSEGKEFAIDISKIIIESALDKLALSDISHYVKPLLRNIFNRYGKEVWPFFVEAIKDTDRLKEYRLIQLLNPENSFDRKGASVLADLPDTLLREWCFHEPDRAPEFVAQATDVLLETGEGYQISPRAKFLVDNFGENEGVLSALSVNIGSFAWSGSLVPYHKKELAAFETLRTHERASVRRWADRRVEYLNKMIEKEKRCDEEHDWGIY